MHIAPWREPIAPQQALEWTLTGLQDDAHPVALFAAEVWEELPALARRFLGRPLVGAFSPLTQLERSFSAALQAQRLPTLCMPLERAPLIPALRREAHVGAAVLLWAERERVEPHLSDMLRVYVLLPDERPAPAPHALFSMHLVPGLTILLQCDALAGSRSFHPSERFDWEFTHASAALSDTHGRFAHLALPGPLSVVRERCACGRENTIELL